jgi:hypothetical protein
MELHRTALFFLLQPSYVLCRYLNLKFFMTTLPHILLHLVYKSGIVLIRLFTLFIVSNTAGRFSVCMFLTTGSWDSAVGIVTGYWLGDQGVRIRVLVGSRMFTSPCYPDRLWGPPNLLYNGYQGLFPRR